MMPRKHSLDERKHGLDIHNYELGDCKRVCQNSIFEAMNLEFEI